MTKSKKQNEAEPKVNFKILIIIGLALLFAFLVNTFFYTNTRVDGASMSPTLNANDWVITDRRAYLHSDPQLGDIVVVHKPDVTKEPIVKRIIGTPKDSVEIKDGQLFINDKLIENDFARMQKSENMKKITVPQNCYFLMGDSRNVSNDSRKWKNPFATKDEIIGKVCFAYFPKFVKMK